MANSFESIVKNIVKKVLRTEYPHAAEPVILMARITRREDCGDHYLYGFVVLDPNRRRDEKYPEFAKIKSRQGYKTGDLVVIALIRGRDAYIMGGTV